MFCISLINCSILLIVIIYRPPEPHSSFLDEFSEFASNFAETKDYIGDFNIHVDVERDILSSQITKNFEVRWILRSSECSHTHRHEHTYE